MIRLVLMGPPGAGKGTQAKVIATELGTPHVATGDIFRANAAEKTELGVQAKRYMDAGDYVPDSVTNDMVHDRLTQADASGGFLLDGYPRTVAQVEELDKMLAAAGHRLDKVVALTVDTDEVVTRLLKRVAEQGRADDTEDVIRHRLDLYTAQTQPLLTVYRERGLLAEVDGLGSVEEVTARVIAALRD